VTAAAITNPPSRAAPRRRTTATASPAHSPQTATELPAPYGCHQSPATLPTSPATR
jgi:hypothetical protein